MRPPFFFLAPIMAYGFGWLGWLLQLVDWTDGCIGVTDSDMDEIWAMVPDGTPIEIEL
jgi:murein L,D-transpeptidase YafK